MRSGNKTKRKLRAELFVFAYMRHLELLQTCLRFVERIERQGGIVLRFLVLVVELGVFFLQMAGVGQDDSAQIDRGLRGINRSGEAFFH